MFELNIYHLHFGNEPNLLRSQARDWECNVFMNILFFLFLTLTVTLHKLYPYVVVVDHSFPHPATAIASSASFLRGK